MYKGIYVLRVLYNNNNNDILSDLIINTQRKLKILNFITFKIFSRIFNNNILYLILEIWVWLPCFVLHFQFSRSCQMLVFSNTYPFFSYTLLFFIIQGPPCDIFPTRFSFNNYFRSNFFLWTVLPNSNFYFWIYSIIWVFRR
jgi:hypothetical protein